MNEEKQSFVNTQTSEQTTVGRIVFSPYPQKSFEERIKELAAKAGEEV